MQCFIDTKYIFIDNVLHFFLSQLSFLHFVQVIHDTTMHTYMYFVYVLVFCYVFACAVAMFMVNVIAKLFAR